MPEIFLYLNKFPLFAEWKMVEWETEQFFAKAR